MSGLIDKRKRSREDDICDSTPLSKRINQLHLTNFEDVQSQSNTAHATARHIAITQLYSSHDDQVNIDHHHSKQLVHTLTATDQHHLSYNPELNEAENPFYYIKNKLLHELHFERLKRCAV